MAKGFSSKKTESLFNHIISQDRTGEQFCELANRIKEYGNNLVYEHHKKLIDEFMEHHQETIYSQMYF